MISKIMEKLNKPFEPITTLIIIYLALIAISIALYALIQIYVDEKELASSLLGWSATMFATIALLYTFNSWKHQRKMEELSILAKEIYKDFTFSYSNIHQINGIVWDLLEKDEDTINYIKNYTEEELQKLFEIKAEDKLFEFSQIIDDKELSEDIINFLGDVGGLMAVFMIFKNDLYSKHSIITIKNNENIIDRFNSINERIKSISYFI